MDISLLSASNDITLITHYSSSTDSTGLHTIEESVYHIPGIWVFFVGALILYLFNFIYWQIQHRLEK